VVNFDSNDVSILFGNGDGSFRLASSPAVPFLPTSMIADDFNQDTRADLAVGNDLRYCLDPARHCDGIFQPAQRLHSEIGHDSLAGGDFDGDGHRDLAVSHFDPNHVSVLLGRGDGTFQRPLRYGARSNPRSLATTFAGDG
jgi:hypothetical protein